MKPGLIIALRCLSGLALLPASYLLVTGCTGHRAASAARSAKGHENHPDVEGEQDCATCHRPDLAESFKAWEDSPHGIALVKCVVCHGSTGPDYRPRPDSRGCIGCHAVQVAQLEALAEEEDRPIRDCFACHSHHTLSSNPHR